MEELFIKIENSEILETIDNLNLNNRLITTKEGKFIVKIDYEPLIQTPSEFENINTKEEISKSSELFQTQDSLHQAAPISSDSEPSLKVINKKTVNNSCSRKSLFNTKNKQKNHRKKCICDVCQRTFASKRTIKGHLSNFHGSIKCLFCPQTFASEKFQKKHIIFTHIERKIKCSLCPKKFISIQYLNLHMHHHENERLAILSKTSKDITVYKCEICQRNYYDIFIFRRHERCHRNRRTIKKIFKCDVCDERFTQSRYLISHKRIHDDNTLSFDCDICKKKFTRKSSLRLHVESHTDQRKYACQLCTKTYKLAKGLTRHMHKHNLHKYNPDVKNKYVMNSLGKYECEECQTILSSSGTLRRHLLTHYGNKKNACPFCGKEFFRKGDLDVHIRMHTGEKPFSCSKCGKKFAHLGNMRKHERKDH